MTYKQIMAHKNCRTMIKQDLETAGHRDQHPQHRSSASSRSSSHHKKASRHRR
jgi:hypothetical protein